MAKLIYSSKLTMIFFTPDLLLKLNDESRKRIIFLLCMLSVSSDGAHGHVYVYTDSEFCIKFTF